MVVIEVDRDFDRFNDLLGLHAWDKFLSRPNKEQKDKLSKVFYCTYNSGRQVEKSGPSAKSLYSVNTLTHNWQAGSVSPSRNIGSMDGLPTMREWCSHILPWFTLTIYY